MAALTNSSSLFQDLFGVSPQPHAVVEKDHFDHVSAYIETTQGAWDVFRSFENAIVWAQKLPSLSKAGSELLGRVSEVVSTAGIGLSIPAILSDCNNLRHSLSRLISFQASVYDDPSRTRNIRQAAHKSFLDLLGLMNDSSQAIIFLDRVKIIILEARHLRIVDGVYNSTSVICDGAELVGECFKLNHYNSQAAQGCSTAEANKLAEKKMLAMLIIAKDIVSLASGAIALIGIVFGIATQDIALVAAAGLVLSTAWLTLKITSYFYNKIVVEAPLAP